MPFACQKNANAIWAKRTLLRLLQTITFFVGAPAAAAAPAAQAAAPALSTAPAVVATVASPAAPAPPSLAAVATAAAAASPSMICRDDHEYELHTSNFYVMSGRSRWD